MMRCRTALLLLAALVLTACGQKGPLYLPDEARPADAAPAAPPATDEDETDDEGGA